MASRRQALMHSALFSAGFGLVGTQAALAASPYRFNPGSSTMVYTRKLSRGLAGGGAIVVERQFHISFIATADSGFEVSGKQVHVQVDVPAPLQSLAGIERNRVEDGLFPISLDAQGMIQSKRPVSANDATKQAVAKALTMSERANAISDPTIYRQFLQQVQQSASQFMSQLPADLFAPSTQPVISRRELPLPGDLKGEVEVLYKSAADPSSGLLTAARREVTTRIGDDSRTAQEAWTLKPA